MKLHLVAIGGTGMGALAGLLKAAGHEVRGSDAGLYPPMSDQLAELGVHLYDGFAADNLAWGPDVVVVGNVCSREHVEVVEAQRLGLPLASLPQTLSEQFLAERHPVVVAGTHGKTTLSSLVTHILLAAGRDPSCFIGGVPVLLGRGWRLGQGPEFVVEGDEYDSAFFDKGSKFLHYRPRTALLTSIELDHVDIFATMDAVRDTFRRFVALIPPEGLLCVAASSREALAVAAGAACKVESYAHGERAQAGTVPTWRGTAVEAVAGGRTRFEVQRDGTPFVRLETNVIGDHNLENVVGAVAATASLGVAPDAIRAAVASFAGVQRRQELRGVAQGVYVVDDYGHHPTAISETLQALRRRYNGRRIIALYEPRSATSRRHTFQHELSAAFAHADHVVVGRLFKPESIPVSERFDPAQFALDLHRAGTAASYLESTDAIVAHVIDAARPGDVVVVFSSGSFDGIHGKLLAALGDAVMPAERTDMTRIREILHITELDHQDVDDGAHRNFLVLRNEHGVVGCIGVELYGDEAILRSLAVQRESRGQGLGWMLADAAVAQARNRGVRRMYLLTETASDFFAEKLGFRVVDLATVSDDVARSRTFQRQSGKRATAMRLDL